MKSVFGDLVFQTGWKCKKSIRLFQQNQSITVKARAYYETDGITSEQEKAFSMYKSHEAKLLKQTERMLEDFAKGAADKRFAPRTLLFERDGGYALLFDDAEDPDGGIAVVLAPEKKIMSQDDYL